MQYSSRASWVSCVVLSLVTACGADRGTSGAKRSGQDKSGGSSGTIDLDFGDPNEAVRDDGLGSGIDSENTCGFQSHKLERQPAELLLVLDRSGSMKSRLRNSTNSKWVDATAALDETIAATESQVLWGLKVFPNGTDACRVDEGIDLPNAISGYAMMSSSITATTPDGEGTPTRMAMNAAVQHMTSLTSTNAKYLVLATDGQPTCADDRSTRAPDEAGAIAAVEAAAQAGFHTFVVGIATSGSEGHATLNEMAVKGLEPRVGDVKYYAVESRQELVDALATITGLISTCNFPLEKAPPSRDDVAVNVNGMRVPRDENRSDGWDYSDDNASVRLFGKWCDDLKADITGASKVDIVFGCPGVVIP